MKAKIIATAQRLLNLYRQEHVILGGWAAVNRVFVDEATDDVIVELREMPNGKLLAQHIENLRRGVTPMDGIERDLLPYGGQMSETISSINLTQSQWRELEYGLEQFTPDQNGLDMIQNLAVVRQFGDEWIGAIKSAIASRPHLGDKWNIVVQTYKAYNLWNQANQILGQPLTERSQAEIQADMPEYETYLPMFGDAGNELLGKLRTFISSMKTPEN